MKQKEAVEERKYFMEKVRRITGAVLCLIFALTVLISPVKSAQTELLYNNSEVYENTDAVREVVTEDIGESLQTRTETEEDSETDSEAGENDESEVSGVPSGEVEDESPVDTESAEVSEEEESSNAEVFESGTGTKQNPYVIVTAEQLRAFGTSVANGEVYTDKYISLGADIDVSGEEWNPIGGSSNMFNGSFDGNGYSVKGMRIGLVDSPKELDSENIYIGFFGLLGEKAEVRDVTLKNIGMYTSYTASAYVGGIAGYMKGVSGSSYTGAIVDGCFVSGKIVHTSSDGNQFVGGIAGMQYKGAVINSVVKADISCTVEGGYLAEVGGLIGLNNRGLVANSYSVSSIYGSGNRDNGNEGMAAVSPLVAVNAGVLVNCYGSGNVTTKEYSVYAGMVSGWVTGIGKSYLCRYDGDSEMIIGRDTDTPQYVKPVEAIGTKVASGVNEHGDAYAGGIVYGISSYKKTDYAEVTEELNGSFGEFPADITLYGVTQDALRLWEYDREQNEAVLGEQNKSVTYKQPECEKITQSENSMRNGVWYGRDVAKSTVVEITVADGVIKSTKAVSGDESGAAFEEALEIAKKKAVYGDFSNYGTADTTKFSGGTGTKDDPYVISTKEQLKYLSGSVNEDVSWSGVYFVQTADIDLSGEEWRPIGWALSAEEDGKKTLVGAYPFRGNYDGGDYKITNLTIGSDSSPADLMTSGLFGFTAGELTTNESPEGDEQTVTLKNIHLENISINVSTRYESYTGGLTGNAQTGIYIDNCSVTGIVSTYSKDGIARAGGLAGNVLRGAVTNSWTDVEVSSETDTSNAYAGGFYSMDNRVTTINCYALGDVTANSGSNNKVHIGGFCGMSGGVHINCYARGDVISLRTTIDIGGINGRSAAISADYNCYYNGDAVQKQGETVISPCKAVGVNAGNSALVIGVDSISAEKMSGDDFAVMLNANKDKVSELLTEGSEIYEFLYNTLQDKGMAHHDYYTGVRLFGWRLKDGVTGFADSAVVSVTAQNGSVNGAGTYSIGKTVKLTAAADSGYTFSGWYIDGKLVSSAAEYTFTAEADVNITALFSRASGTGKPSAGGVSSTSCTVVFETNGGSVTESRNIGWNSTVEEPEIPVREGYIFKGWYIDKELKTAYDFSTRVKGSMTLYAAWENADAFREQIIMEIGKNKVLVFGEEKYTDAPAILEEGLVLVPVRHVAESLGAEVEWFDAEQKVRITKDEAEIIIFIGSDKVRVNGKESSMKTAAFIEGGRTYIQAQIVPEALGYSAVLSETEQKITISKQN